MLHRPSLRSVFTTVAAAAVLVGGANLASYAANGHPLLLGHANSANGTTSLKNLGRGPALKLNTAKSSPPLVVNSGKLVKNLNAAKVGEMSSSQLSPGVWRFKVGKAGQALTPNGEHLFTFSLPKGTYQIQISGFLNSSSTSDSFDCVTADLNKVLAMDESGLWAVHEGAFDTFAGGIVDAADVETVKHATKVVYGCETGSSTGTVTVIRPATFTFRQVPVVDKKGKVFALTPKHGLLHGLAH
jgi:hypothetical protein